MLYMRHRSVMLDLKLIFLTFMVLIISRRVMKWKVTERFLGFELGVDHEEIEPTVEAYKDVTGT